MMNFSSQISHSNQKEEEQGFHSQGLFQFHIYNPETLHISPINSIANCTYSKSTDGQNNSLDQKFNIVSTLLKKHSKFLLFQVYEKSSLHQMLYNEDLIGIMGKSKIQNTETDHNFVNEGILINENCKIASLTVLRPYGFSNIFLISDVQSLSAEILVKCLQTVSFKFESVDEVREFLEKVELEITKIYRDKKIKKIEEKLKIQINIIKNQIWMTMNRKRQNPLFFVSYFEKILGIKNLKEQVANKLSQEISFQQLNSLIKIKQDFPVLLEQEICKILKIKSLRKIYKKEESDQSSESSSFQEIDSNEEQDSDMEAEEEVEPNISLIPEECSKEKQTLAIVGKRKRSRTVDNRTQTIKSELQQRHREINEKIFEQIYQFY